MPVTRNSVVKVILVMPSQISEVYRQCSCLSCFPILKLKLSSLPLLLRETGSNLYRGSAFVGKLAYRKDFQTMISAGVVSLSTFQFRLKHHINKCTLKIMIKNLPSDRWGSWNINVLGAQSGVFIYMTRAALLFLCINTVCNK